MANDDPTQSAPARAAAVAVSAAAAAAGAAATGTSLGVPLAAVAGLGAVPVVFETVLRAAADWKQRDVDKWWRRVVRADGAQTSEAFEQEINSKRDEPHVRDTILRSVRSLLDAIASDAIEPLAVLARLYLRSGTSPDAFFRGAARVLADFSNAELKDLEDVVVWSLDSTDPRRATLTLYASHTEQVSAGEWREIPWCIQTARDEFTPPVGTSNLGDAPFDRRYLRLDGLSDPMRIVFALRANGLGRGTSGVAFNAGPGTLIIDRDVLDRLRVLLVA